MNYREQIRQFTLDLVSGVNGTKEFQSWLQENIGNFDQDELEFALPLIEIDLQRRNGSYAFMNSIKDQYRILFGAQLEKDRAKYLLSQIANGTGDLVLWCRELSKLLDDGIEFLPIEFKGFNSELDDVPLERDAGQWDGAAFIEKRTKISLYAAAIRELAVKTLSLLQKK